VTVAGQICCPAPRRWDRDAYIKSVGGPAEAERRRKALMARQSGQRLADERLLAD
jgi:hypothetical protein